jgi:hypothetical protein
MENERICAAVDILETYAAGGGIGLAYGLLCSRQHEVFVAL